MSSNPQWSTFQPPIMNSDSAILEFKSVLQPSSGSSSTSYDSPPNGTFGMFNRKEAQGNGSSSGAYSSSSGGSFNKGSGTFTGSYTSSYTSYSNSVTGSVGGGGGGGGGNSKPYSPNPGKFPPIGVFNESTISGGSGDRTDRERSGSNVFSTDNVSSNGNSNPNSHYSNSNSYGDSSPNNQGIRETGIIEKLLHSYGFIQCCERQARLFFHFSQFDGNIEHLKIGDPVEFEMTYDRRTGKPIASAVTKIGPEVVLSEERVTGTVTTELRQEGSGGGSSHSGSNSSHGSSQSASDLQGRISYENRGECFFLPYVAEDVEGHVSLRSGDKVSFQIATNQRSGNLAARHVRLENPAHPVRYQGVVCSMKESFGFIERADVVKEIFFHFSEAKGMRDELKLGDDVEFSIQTRNGKEVACNICRLAGGTVVFEDVGKEVMKGQVLKPIKKGQQWHQSDPLPGRIRYRGHDRSEVEIPFGEKDQKGDFTLKHGDWVQFCIATDRRDQLQRATRITLLEESFLVSGEKREQGIIVVLKEGFGFLRCVERDARMFFHFSEVLDVDRDVCLNDEVEFTVVQDPTTPNRQSAIRIKHLTLGTVQFETITHRDVEGVVTREAANSWGQRSNGKSVQMSGSGDKTPQEAGLISYTLNDSKESIIFYLKDCEPRQLPRVGDKVEFNICQTRQSKELTAVCVRVTEAKALSPPSSKSSPSTQNQSGNASNSAASSCTSSPAGSSFSSNANNLPPPCQGFIAALKDGFGFIETLVHDREIFFHFSTYDGDANNLELGQEVEYIVSPKTNSSGRLSTENVRPLSKGTVKLPAVKEEVMEGVVSRPVRSVNPDQNEYSGLVQVINEDGEGPEYEFGITSLQNKREILQPGDPVQFQLDVEGRAANIVALRKKLRATVEAVKAQFGFLSYEVDGKKLFFHMSEVKDGVGLQQGDEVEFVVVTNQRTGKSSACNVVKLRFGTLTAQRPERLISRLRTVSTEEGPQRVTVVRQPRGPDGTKGFTFVREVRAPGVITPALLA